MDNENLIVCLFDLFCNQRDTKNMDVACSCDAIAAEYDFDIANLPKELYEAVYDIRVRAAVEDHADAEAKIISMGDFND